MIERNDTKGLKIAKYVENYDSLKFTSRAKYKSDDIFISIQYLYYKIENVIDEKELKYEGKSTLINYAKICNVDEKHPLYQLIKKIVNKYVLYIYYDVFSYTNIPMLDDRYKKICGRNFIEKRSIYFCYICQLANILYKLGKDITINDKIFINTLIFENLESIECYDLNNVYFYNLAEKYYDYFGENI